MEVVTVVMIGARDTMAVQLYAFIGTEINAALNYVPVSSARIPSTRYSDLRYAQLPSLC